MKTYAINHTQNRAYVFSSKKEAEIWHKIFINNSGKGDIIEAADVKQFLAAYKDKLVKVKMVQGLHGIGFVKE